MQKKFADTKYLRIFVVLLAMKLQLKTNIMTNLIENKTVKVIKDFTGDEWNACKTRMRSVAITFFRF